MTPEELLNDVEKICKIFSVQLIISGETGKYIESYQTQPDFE